jgi:DNA-3-methyladenine glycosylase
VPENELSEPVKLARSFYRQETAALARALLGQRLVRVYRGRRRSGIIVETEAYLGARDPACHTWKNRKSQRNASMFLPGGHAYVYFVYGMHFCFNVVAKKASEPEAVLIRALAPEENLRARADGPARLCKAMAISLAQDGADLTGETIFIERAESPRQEEIGASPRIGVDYAGEAAAWPLRFTWRGNPHLSRKEGK